MPVWEQAQVLLAGAILSPGTRPITSALRVRGLCAEKNFQTDHRVLHRARWSALAASRVLLGLLVAVFAPTGVVVCGLDDTIERRRGEQIKATGVYCDPVRSSHSHFVKASGPALVLLYVAARCCALCSGTEAPAGAKGRPRLKGTRRRRLKAVLDDPATSWTRVTVGH